MVGVQGLGGVPDPQPDRASDVRSKKSEAARTSESAPKDGVAISAEAQEAANVAKYVELAKEEPDVRDEKIQEAREAIARGEYNGQTVVQRIAETLSKVL